eukprot:SAG31_NODE_2212_length_6174_cov_11.856790_7_plen_121_part_00
MLSYLPGYVAPPDVEKHPSEATDRKQNQSLESRRFGTEATVNSDTRQDGKEKKPRKERKPVELDAEGNPVKRARKPRKEKAVELDADGNPIIKISARGKCSLMLLNAPQCSLTLLNAPTR